MNKLIIGLLVAMIFPFIATANNTLIMSSELGCPDDEVTITASLANEADVVAAEIQIPLTKYTTYVDGSATLNTQRTNDHNINAAVVNDTLRIYIYSMSLSPIKGNGGELMSFRLRLGKEPADYQLSPRVILSDATGAALATTVEEGVVTILSPKLTITTASINWGRVAIRSSYNKTLTLKNTGNELLVVTGFEFSNCDFSTTTSLLTIEPGASQNVTISYAPIVRGSIDANVTIESNAINGDQSAQLLATPYSVNELHVLRTSGVSDEVVTVALRLKNMEPIVGMQCEFTMPDQLKFVEGSFEVNKNRCSNHQAIASLVDKKLTLYMYSPTNAAVEEGNDTIATFKVRLDGTNGSYYLKPANVILSNITEENMTSSTSQNYVTIKSPKMQSDAMVDMGSNPVTEIAEKAYSIYNSGQVDLVIEKVAFLSDGYKIKEALPLTIKSKGTSVITVEYTPTAEGPHSTMMQVYSNDPLNRMKSVPVSGEIFEPNYVRVSGKPSLSQNQYELNVALDNYSDIVAIQMDLHWIEGMETSIDSLVKNNRLKNHSVSVTKIGNCDYRILVYSMSNSPIIENEGNLFSMMFTKQDENMSFFGSVIAIDNIILSNKNSINKVSENSISFPIANLILASTLTLSEQTITLKEGESTKITATLYPENITYRDLKWEIDNEDVATIVDNGDCTATITLLCLGEATITVSTLDGSNLVAKCGINHVVGVEDCEKIDKVIVVSRYDIHGRLISEPTKGINIIKMSNGTTRKEIVK